MVNIIDRTPLHLLEPSPSMARTEWTTIDESDDLGDASYVLSGPGTRHMRLQSAQCFQNADSAVPADRTWSSSHFCGHELREIVLESR